MKKIIVILFVLAITNVKSQSDTIFRNYKSLVNSPNSNYYEIKQAFNAYLASLPNDSINSIIKEFKRFESFWDGRAGSYNSAQTGNFNDLNNLYKVYNNSVVCEDEQYYLDNEISKWELDGPKSEPGGLNNGINNIGHVSAVLVLSNNQYLIGTNASGIWKTYDGGVNWKCVTDEEKLFGIGVTSIINDPTDVSGNTLYASTGYNTYGPSFGIGVIKSTDGGETWTVPSNISNLFIVNVIFKVAISENGILYAISGKQVFKSIDGANNWIEITPNIGNTIDFTANSNLEWIDLDLVPGNSGNRLFIASRDFGVSGGGAQLLSSSDGGNNWRNETNNLQGWEALNLMSINYNFELGSGSLSAWVTSNWHLLNISGNNVGAVTPDLIGKQIQKGVFFKGTKNGKFYFDAHIPANTMLRVEFKNIFTGVNYQVYESDFDNSDQTILQHEIPFQYSALLDDDIPTTVIFTAISDNNYSGIDELWIDNLRLTPPVVGSERIAISCPNNSTAYAMFTIGEDAVINSIDLTTDLFTNYQTVPNAGTNYYNLNGQKFEFAASQFRNDAFYYGGIYMYKLENHLETQIHGIVPTDLHVDIRALSIFDFDGSQESLILGTDGGVVVSLDGGDSWTDKNGNISITQFYSVDMEENNPDFLVSGAIDQGTFTLVNNDWSIIIAGFDGGNTKVQNGEIFAQANNRFSNFNSGGETYIDDWGLNRPIEVTNETSPTVFIGGGNNLYKADADFISVDTQILNNEGVTAVGIHPTNQNLIYMAKGGVPDGNQIIGMNLYISTDKGDNWTIIPEPFDLLGNSIYEDFFVGDFTFDPDNENRVWCSVKGNNSSVNEIHSRVFYSEDYGQTWSDLSVDNGLPPFSVNTITRQNGSNDIIYVGTDIGVFYCEDCDDPQTAQWNCFNNELPPCIISDLKINYCQNKLYASTFGRGIWNVDIIKTEKSISGNIVWSQPTKLNGNLRITAGSSLVVSSTVDIPEGCKIIVERNAYLNLSGGTLTNSCGSMWHGVEVWGDATSPQPYNQGRFTALNNSIIEHSRNGVYTYKQDDAGNIDMAYTGGIIRSYTSTFRNNQTSIKFLPYTAYSFGNASIFVLTNFVTDDVLNDESILPAEQVLLYGVRNMRFVGCKFQNSRMQGSFPLSDRGVGILSFGSIFKVLPTQGNQRSEFTGLYRGIKASSGNPLTSFIVHKAKFENNTRGIIANGIDLAAILENEFIIPDLQSLEAPYGIYMNYCSDYEIEENTFTSPTGNLNVGIGVFNSGNDPNRIYNNSFDKMYAGQLLMGDNRNTTSGAGLQVLCNENVNNGYDAALTAQGEIGNNQGFFGTQSSPAGNVFSHNCVGGDNDYFAQSSPNSFNYFTHNNISPTCFTISDITLNLTGFIYDPLNREASCPPELSINTPPITHRSLFGYFKDLYADRILLIDGGNTQNVLNYLNANNSPGHIKNYLMELSPYLSDEILMKVIDKNLPAGHIKQILLANSPLSAEVLDYFIQTSYPSGIKNQVQNEQTGISERSKLNAELAYYDSEKNKAAGDYIRYYLLVDTTVTAKDSIKMMLAQSGIPDALCKKAAFDIHNGDFADAATKVGDLNTIEPDDAFCKLLNVLLELEQTIDKCFSITPPQKEMLEAIAEEHDKEACKNAQALLELVYKLSFPEIIEFPIENRSHFENEKINNSIIKTENIRIFPNPTSDYLYIEMDKEHFDTGTFTFTIYDIVGKKLLFTQARSQWESLDISKLSTGTYIISIEVNGESINRLKFVKE